jgi:hypothetical protein
MKYEPACLDGSQAGYELLYPEALEGYLEYNIMNALP